MKAPSTGLHWTFLPMALNIACVHKHNLHGTAFVLLLVVHRYYMMAC
jgi:hypothetical protein